MTRIGTEPGRLLPLIGSLRETFTAQCYFLAGSRAKKTYVALTDQAVVSGTRFVTTLMIGRWCGAAELGLYALTFTLMILILGAQQSLVATPYTVYGNRLGGAARRESAGSAMIHCVLLGFISLAILTIGGVLCAMGMGPAGLAPLIWVLVGILPFALLQDFARRFAFAHLHMGRALVLDVIVATIQIGGLVLLLTTGLLSAAAAYVVLAMGCAVAGIVWLVLNRDDLTVRWSAIWPDMRRNWSLGKWVFGALAGLMLNGYIMYWILAMNLDAAATGVYAACLTVLLFANPVLMGVSNVLMPMAAKAYSDLGASELWRVVVKITMYVSVPITLFCGIVALFGGRIVPLLYGYGEYAGLGAIMAVLAAGYLAGALSMGMIDGLLAYGRPDINFKVSVAGLMVQLIVAMTLLPPLGVLGAAIAYLAGNVTMTTIRTVVFVRVVHPARQTV